MARYRAGDNTSAIRLLDVESAKPVPLEIPNVLEAVQWLPDAIRLPLPHLKDAGDRSQPPGPVSSSRDIAGRAIELLYRQPTKSENPRLAQGGGPSGTLSRDGRWLLLSYWLDSGTNDLWLASFDEYPAEGRARVPSRQRGKTDAPTAP